MFKTAVGISVFTFRNNVALGFVVGIYIKLLVEDALHGSFLVKLTGSNDVCDFIGAHGLEIFHVFGNIEQGEEACILCSGNVTVVGAFAFNAFVTFQLDVPA